MTETARALAEDWYNRNVSAAWEPTRLGNIDDLAAVISAAVAEAVAGERQQVVTEAAIFWVGVATRFRLDGDRQVAHELDKAITVMQDTIRSRGEGE
jgi:hypothetical protein